MNWRPIHVPGISDECFMVAFIIMMVLHTCLDVLLDEAVDERVILDSSKTHFIILIHLAMQVYMYLHVLVELDLHEKEITPMIFGSGKIQAVCEDVHIPIPLLDEWEEDTSVNHGNTTKDCKDEDMTKGRKKKLRQRKRSLLHLSFKFYLGQRITNRTCPKVNKKCLETVSWLFSFFTYDPVVLVYPVVTEDDPEFVDDNVNDVHQNRSQRLRLSGMSDTQAIQLHNLATHRRSFNALTIYEDSSFAVTGRRNDIPMVQQPHSSGFGSGLSLLSDSYRLRSANFSFSLQISADEPPVQLHQEPVSYVLPQITQERQDRCNIHDTVQPPQQPVCRILPQNTEQGHRSNQEAVKIDEAKCQLTEMKELSCTLKTNQPMPSTSGTCQVPPSTNKTNGHWEGKHQESQFRSKCKETRAGVQVNVTHETCRSDNSAETQEDLDERPTESTSPQASYVDFPRRSAGENEESNGNGNQYGSFNRIHYDLDSGIGSCVDPTNTDRSYHSNPEREIDGSFDIMRAFGFGHEPWEIGDGLSNNDDDPHELEIHGDIHVPREIGEMSFTTEPMPNRLSRETMESQLPWFEQLLPAEELEIETSCSDIKDKED